MCPHATIFDTRNIEELGDAKLHSLGYGAKTPLAFSKLCVLYYMCHHTTIYVSAYCRGLCEALRDARPGACGKAYYMCSHTTICDLVLLHMCPHTTFHASSYYYICVLMLVYMSPHTTIFRGLFEALRAARDCVLILKYMCPHTTTCVLMLLCAGAFSKLCVLPETCGEACGEAGTHFT